jgi:hypothetical protein
MLICTIHWNNETHQTTAFEVNSRVPRGLHMRTGLWPSVRYLKFFFPGPILSPLPTPHSFPRHLHCNHTHGRPVLESRQRQKHSNYTPPRTASRDFLGIIPVTLRNTYSEGARKPLIGKGRRGLYVQSSDTDPELGGTTIHR